MKVTSVKVFPLTVKNEYSPGGSLSYAIVRIQTDEDITGYGEISDSFGCTYPGLMKEVVDQVLMRFLLDEDPLETERLLNKMVSWTRGCLGDSWIIVQAISGIEIALLDILGKARKQPIYKMLGEKRDRIDLYASGTYLELRSVESFMDLFRKPLDHGIKAIKVRIGKDYEKDLIKLKELRAKIGDGVKIMIDGNESFTVTTAMRISEKLHDHNVYFFEEPLPVFNIEGMSRLKAASKVPIAYGEHTFNISGFTELINRNAADILQPDATISGGILECKKIGDLAHLNGLQVCPHSACGPIGLAANLHLSACLPTFQMLEYGFVIREYLSKMLLKDEKINLEHVKNGSIEVPKGPGLGIEVKEEVLKKFPYRALGVEKQTYIFSQGKI
jgi:L-alanine-DL-glutamate epimerase-like enolase superfamily enzyme